MSDDDVPVKIGRDDKLEAKANKLLYGSVGKNKRHQDRDLEKMAYEYGLTPLDELQFYDPANDWDTQDSAFLVFVNPSEMDGIEPSICDDGNVRAANPSLSERRRLMRHVGDEDGWGPTGESIPILGCNKGPRKTCTRCGRARGLQFFARDRRNKADGLYSWCKECHLENKRLTYQSRKNRE